MVGTGSLRLPILPGCPRFSAFTFDQDGVIKDIEIKEGIPGRPTVNNSWGEPDPSRAVVAATLLEPEDQQIDTLMAVARPTGEVDIMDDKGTLRYTSTYNQPVVGLHLFNKKFTESSFRLLSYTKEGKGMIESFEVSDESVIKTYEELALKVGDNWEIHCSKVHPNENFSLFGGKEPSGLAGIYKYNFETDCISWSSEQHDLCKPEKVTSMSFLGDENEDSFVVGTNKHEVRRYDSRQKKPCKVIDLWARTHGKQATSIQAIIEGPTKDKVYIGTYSGDLYNLDLDTGKATEFSGSGVTGYRHLQTTYTQPQIAVSDSIKFLLQHPKYPIIASGGGRWLNIWDVRTQIQISMIDFKRPLTTMFFSQRGALLDG